MTDPSPESAVRQAEPAPTSKPSRRELIFVAAGAVAAFIAHWCFRLSGFGEQDAARLAGDAIHWHASRAIYMDQVDYRLRTSPLYIQSLKLALDHGLPIRALPGLMNGASVLLSSACSVGLYFLFRRLSNAKVAALATVLYGLTPCFWLGSVYGMPTLPSLTFWVFAVLAFARATDEPKLNSEPFAAYLSLSLVLTCIAIALKADMALCGGALITVLLLERRARPVLLAGAGAIVIIGAAFALLYAKHLAAPVVVVNPDSVNTLRGFLHEWSTRFPFQWSLLIDPKNNAPITHASGTLLFGLILIALAHGLVSGRESARRTLALSIWGWTPLLFWGLKPGNSARHNLPAFAPLVLLAAGFVFRLAEQKPRRAWLLAALLSGLALFDTSGPNSVTPNVNVLTATHNVEFSTSALHQRARAFAALNSPKKAIIESDYLLDYSEFEVWAAAKKPVLRAEQSAILDGPDHETRIYKVAGQRDARTLAQRLRREGWDVFSVQYSL